MSDNNDKLKHSKRLHKDENAINKQKAIAKSHGVDPGHEHGLAKKHVMNCGDSNCVLCGNPRKFFKEKTIQERRKEQDPGDE